MTGYCLKVEVFGMGEDSKTVKMVDLKNFIVDHRVPISDINTIFAEEIQKLILKHSRQGLKAKNMEIREKQASLKLAIGKCEIEYKLWILRTSYSS